MDGVRRTVVKNGAIYVIEAPAAGIWSVTIAGHGSYQFAARAESDLSWDRARFVDMRGRPGHQGWFPFPADCSKAGKRHSRQNSQGLCPTHRRSRSSTRSETCSRTPSSCLTTGIQTSRFSVVSRCRGGRSASFSGRATSNGSSKNDLIPVPPRGRVPGSIGPRLQRRIAPPSTSCRSPPWTLSKSIKSSGPASTTEPPPDLHHVGERPADDCCSRLPRNGSVSDLRGGESARRRTARALSRGLRAVRGPVRQADRRSGRLPGPSIAPGALCRVHGSGASSPLGDADRLRPAPAR